MKKKCFLSLIFNSLKCLWADKTSNSFKNASSQTWKSCFRRTVIDDFWHLKDLFYFAIYVLSFFLPDIMMYFFQMHKLPCELWHCLCLAWPVSLTFPIQFFWKKKIKVWFMTQRKPQRRSLSPAYTGTNRIIVDTLQKKHNSSAW